MIAPGLVVPRARGEEARRDLADSGLLRTDLEILREGEFLVLPLSEGADAVPPSWGTVAEREFRPHTRPGPHRYHDLLPWPDPEKEGLPRSFDIVGDIVLIRLPDALEDRKAAVGEALLRFVPGARLVGLDRGVKGAERRRSVERIAGRGPWRTRHRENGIEFDVDVELAYFSPRLAREHARVAAQVRPGDVVYDLCCGVGPFSLTIARLGRAARVTAVDANPAAIGLLRDTLARLRPATPVHAVVARTEEFVVGAAPADRLVLNLPHEGIKYLPSVARTTAPGGRLYYYEVVHRAESEGRGTTLVKSLAPVGGFAMVAQRVVHPYSPASDLVAFEIDRSKEA